MASSDPQLTALGHVMYVSEEMQDKDARQIVESLGHQGQTVPDVPLGLLSGGQKVRVALAKLFWPPPQLLILDEVTIVKRESPYRLAPGMGGGEDEAEEASDSDDQAGAGPGAVYRLSRRQLRKLEGGMTQYEETAARSAARLGTARRST
ncbi:hypothetical protein P153DRAFT_391131 [Dothidotthia symphoricarpi CBS 119687]|uniref:ABC transporter domain-containing protein n=1 Tax=Dothidotthia symphoricarpi CBS 119687 TaxID=1392245 RepID=A0A6A5ZYJ9_9PLEO|nr:uncharacterized protein P153DRAFT_391131 [Dothidotthia symphoricarpi CBS 119687]KAF2124095.1 hypothetical protein P153DRAFT_391131 [Dothidotthia symphoricarpi CBS 119687]